MDDIEVYTNYYINQAGGNFNNFYSGPIYQRGNGIGSFLSGLFRVVMPLVKKGALAVGDEALKSGLNFVKDIASHGDIRKSIKERGREAIMNMGNRTANHMLGSGLNTGRYFVNKQLKPKRQSVKKRKTIRKNKCSKKKKNIKQKKNNKKKNNKKKNNKKVKRSKSSVYDIFS